MAADPLTEALGKRVPYTPTGQMSKQVWQPWHRPRSSVISPSSRALKRSPNVSKPSAVWAVARPSRFEASQGGLVEYYVSRTDGASCCWSGSPAAHCFTPDDPAGLLRAVSAR